MTPDDNAPRSRRLARIYLIAGGIGLTALYSLSLIPPVQRFLSALETTIFFALNASLGKNPVWDWTILVTASHGWINFSYAVAAGLVVYCVWLRARVDYGRLLGFLAFAGVVAFITEETADFIADNLHRVLPWKQGLVDTISEYYNADFFTMHRDEGIVDDAACAFTCIMMLVFWRIPRAAFALFAIMGMYAFSSILAGTQWLSVQLASAFMGMIFAGGAMRFGTGIEHYLEDKASRWFAASLGHLLLSRKLIGPALKDDRSPAMQSALKALRRGNFLSAERFWEGTVKLRAAKLLALDPNRCELFPSPDSSPGRTRSAERVRFLRTPEDEVFVLRARRDFGGVVRRSKRFAAYAESIADNIMLHRRGFPVPETLWMQEGTQGFGLRNWFVAIERFLPSRPLNPAAPEEGAAAMRLLARLHAIEHPRWGNIHDDKPRNRAQFVLVHLRGTYLLAMKRIDQWLRTGLTQRDTDDLWKLFEGAALDAMNSGEAPFRLIHGDATPRNLRVAPDGGIVMIDFMTMQADLPGWEVIKAALGFAKGNAESCAKSWEGYFAEAGEARWRGFLAESPVALARHALRELSHRRLAPPAIFASGVAQKHLLLDWLRDLIVGGTELWGSEPSQTDWTAINRLLGIAERAPKAIYD